MFSVKLSGNALNVSMETPRHLAQLNELKYVAKIAGVGQQGAHSTVLGELPVELSNVQEGDVIGVKGGKVVNVPRDELVDGGNF